MFGGGEGGVSKTNVFDTAARRIPNVRTPVLFRLKRVFMNTSLSASRLNGRIKLRMPCMLRFITVGRAVFTEFVEAALLKMILFQLLLHA